MQEEQYPRAGSGSAPSAPTDDAAAGPPPVSAAVGPYAAPLGRVEGVPSEQLWRAAILAARQAALAAAELRRALEESAASRAAAPSDGVASASLLT
jgi:hypothetical protein